MSKAKKAAITEKREKWAAAAKAEREARKAPGEKRLAWLNRPCIKAAYSAEGWAAQVAACKAATEGAKPATEETREQRKRRLDRERKAASRAAAKKAGRK